MQQEHDDILGRQVGGYVVTRKLGEGGMGAVYLAENPSLPQKRVLKVLLPEIAKSHPEWVDRFKLEARAASRITHPNVIQILDVAEFADHQPYILMPFLEGRDLEEHCQVTGQSLGHPGRIPVEFAWRILAQVAAALMAAHGKGIIHRDLKASNVFILDESAGLKAILIDFGLAKVDDPLLQGAIRSSPGVALGTPSHMAPEQIRGRPIDRRTDVYAFGTMAYIILTGVAPYTSDSLTDLFALKLLGPPVDPRTHASDIPEAWAACILQCLAIDPDQRPASIKEAAITLMNALPRGPDVAREVAPDLFGAGASWEPTAKAPMGGSPRELAPGPAPASNTTQLAGAVEPSETSRTRSNVWIAVAATVVVAAVLLVVVLGKDRAGRVEHLAAEPAAADAGAVVVSGTNDEAQSPGLDASTPTEAVVLPDGETAEVGVAVLPPANGSSTSRSARAHDGPARTARPALPRDTTKQPLADASGEGTIFVTASPWAEVSIDGRSAGTTPVTQTASAGPHRLKLEKPDGTTEELTVQVKSDQTTRVTRSWSP